MQAYPTPAVKVARFGECALDRGKRELRLRGAVQPLAPRVFDVLAYLIDHRHRVVLKDELFQKVWQGAFVTDSALARAISKARSAIGDAAENPTFIKTVQRVGYCFVGTVTEDDAVVASPTDADAAAMRPADDAAGFPMQLALLPFANQMDEPQLSWVDLGLMSLVRQALSHDSRLALAATADVLVALQPLAPGLSETERALAVLHALNTHCVVSCTVSRVARGFQLAYEGVGPRAHALRGVVEGSELTELGQQVADAIEAMVADGAVRQVPLSSADPFVNQAIARAMEAMTLQRYKQAAMYYRVVMELEPGNHPVCIMAIRAIRPVDSEEAAQRGRQLIADLAGSTDLLLRAGAHEALGSALWQREADDEAQFHLKEAMRLIQGAEPNNLVAHIHAVNTIISLRAGDLQAFERSLKVVEYVARHAGAQDRLCWAVNALAVLDVQLGRFESAQRWVDEACALAREHKKPVNICSSLGTRAELQWSKGQQREAIVTCNELVAELAHCTAPLTMAEEGFQAALVYAKVRRVGDLQRLVALGDTIWPQKEMRYLASLLGTKALLASCQGDTVSAIRLLQQSADIALRARDALKAGLFLVLLGTEALRGGDTATAQDSLERLMRMPSHAINQIQQQSATHLRAALLHSAGQADDARRLLLQLGAQDAAGRTGVMARLDAAWLSAEAGELEGVDALLDDWHMGATSHPLGLAACARVQYARGDAAVAQRLQMQCLALYDAQWTPAWLFEINDAYARGLPCPVLPRLLSVM